MPDRRSITYGLVAWIAIEVVKRILETIVGAILGTIRLLARAFVDTLTAPFRMLGSLAPTPRKSDVVRPVILSPVRVRATCPICAAVLEPGSAAPPSVCASCDTPHHADCAAYQQCCGRYACGSTTFRTTYGARASR